jgi:hypothetical protein
MANEGNKILPRITLCYMGDRVSSKGKRLQAWLETEGLDNEGEQADFWHNRPNGDSRETFYHNLYKWAIVGEIHSFEQSETGLKMSSRKSGGRWQNEIDIAAWKAMDIACNAELEARKKSKQDGMLEELKPVKEAYKRLGAMQRAQFLAKVVKYIVG